MRRRNHLFVAGAAALCLAVAGAPVHAQYFADSGYSALQAELGAAIPKGAGVRVTLVEANVDNVDDDEDGLPDDGSYDFIPNLASSQMSGKSFTTRLPPGTLVAEFSSHANASANRFFGNTSLAPSVTEAELFSAEHWITTGQLRTGEGVAPDYTVHNGSGKTSRIASHSYVGSLAQEDDPETELDESTLMDPALTLEAVQRIDWLVARDNYVQMAGRAANQPLVAGAFNAIGVGSITGTSSSSKTIALSSVYTANRPDVEIVGYENAISSATPQVGAVAVMMIGFAHDNPSLSHGSQLTRNGETIYHAETAEVIKAVLMAGARRDVVTAYPNGHTYTVNTDHGLNTRYGAGLVNSYNSYHILAAGERDSAEDGGGARQRLGFDYDPSFGGANGSNAVATYAFETGGVAELRATLAWHVRIDIDLVNAGDVDNAATLYNLDLLLYEITGGGDVLIAASDSTNENTENLWLTALPAGQYKLVVTPGPGQSAFDWDYGIAWIVTVPEPSSLVLLAGAAPIVWRRRRRRGVTAPCAHD